MTIKPFHWQEKMGRKKVSFKHKLLFPPPPLLWSIISGMRDNFSSASRLSKIILPLCSLALKLKIASISLPEMWFHWHDMKNIYSSEHVNLLNLYNITFRGNFRSCKRTIDLTTKCLKWIRVKEVRAFTSS